MSSTTRFTFAVSAVAAALTLVACSGSGSSNLSVRARSTAGAAAGASSGALELGDGLAVSRVRIAIRELKLELPEAAATAALGAPHDGADDHGGSSGSDDAHEVRMGPFAVDLDAAALAGGVKRVFDAEVPAGTYRELRIHIGPSARLAELGGSSVVIEGTIDGAPFTFTSALTAEQKVEAAMTVSAEGGSSAITLAIDPTGWFVAADGSRLDPASSASRAAIEANLLASIATEYEEGDDKGGGRGGTDGGPGHQ